MRRTGAFTLTSLALLCAAPCALAQGAPPPPPPAAAPQGMAPQGTPPPAPPPPPAGAAAAPGPGQGYPGAPPGYGPPPGGYPYPPPGAPPGQGYAYPPPMPYYGPARLPYVEGDPIPPGYAIETRPRKKLVIAGLSTFVPLYAMSLLFAATYLGNEGLDGSLYTPLFIPAIGPFVTIGTSDAEGFGIITLLLDGVGQLTGVALFAAGMIAQEQYLERSAAASFDPRPEVFVGPGSASLRWQF